MTTERQRMEKIAYTKEEALYRAYQLAEKFIRIGLTGGVFDLQHKNNYAYIKHLSDNNPDGKTVVMLSTDERVKHSKNKTPIISWQDRAEQLSYLPFVDLIVPKGIGENNQTVFNEYQPNLFYYSTTSGVKEFDELQRILKVCQHRINDDGRLIITYLNGRELELRFYDSKMGEHLLSGYTDVDQFMDYLRAQSIYYNESKYNDIHSKDNLSGSIIRERIIQQHLKQQ